MWCSEDGWRIPDQSSEYANTTDQWAGACIYHKVFVMLHVLNVMYFILGTNDNGNIRSWFCSCWIFHYGSFFSNFSKSET